MAKGWHLEPRRHSLASRGVKTAVDNPKEKAMMKTPENKLTIEQTFVPIGSGNNPNAGKMDSHYKIKEWGFVFPTKEDAQKYADEHIEKERYYSEIYKMSGKWYYIIRDKSRNDKMVYSSELTSKANTEKYAKRRTGLYNVQQDIKNM